MVENSSGFKETLDLDGSGKMTKPIEDDVEMIGFDGGLAEEYLTESREHLATVETDLLAIERSGAEINDEPVNRVFRAMHSIEGGAGIFDLVKIRELAHQTEDFLALIRSRQLVPTPDRVTVLLRATDRLKELIQNPGTSNRADIREIMADLARLPVEQPAVSKGCDSTFSHARPNDRPLRILLVEDDVTSRLVLQTFLSRYGECHIAVNGREGVEAFRSILERGQRYDLICMDIMMPEMDGREALRHVRALEEAQGISSTYGAKIIMTTALADIKGVVRCFWELCDSYLVKPIDLTQLLSQLKSYRLVQ
jgi:two-component system chemotaxis response regulator CheY